MTDRQTDRHTDRRRDGETECVRPCTRECVRMCGCDPIDAHKTNYNCNLLGQREKFSEEAFCVVKLRDITIESSQNIDLEYTTTVFILEFCIIPGGHQNSHNGFQKSNRS